MKERSKYTDSYVRVCGLDDYPHRVTHRPSTLAEEPRAGRGAERR